MALSTLAPRQASFRPAVCRPRTVRVVAVHQPHASAFVASAAAALLVSTEFACAARSTALGHAAAAVVGTLRCPVPAHASSTLPATALQPLRQHPACPRSPCFLQLCSAVVAAPLNPVMPELASNPVKKALNKLDSLDPPKGVKGPEVEAQFRK